MIPEVDALFRHMSPGAYAVAQYCSSVIAHRVLKIGWEKQINLLPSRRLILTAMFLPPHCRPAIMDEAYRKACDEGDAEVIALLEQQAKAFAAMKEQALKASA